MGHESPIEPWLAADNRAAWESPNRLASSRQSDENRWQKKPTALREASSVRDHRTEGQNNPAQTGWAGSQEKIRPQERCFFLDSFYRTNQDLAAWPDDRFRAADELPGTDIRQLLDRSHRLYLFLVSACVAAPVTHFVSLKICYFVNTLRRLGFLTDLWRWALIAVIRMKAVIYVTLEIVRAVKPGAGANDHTAGEPFGAVVAVGCAAVGSGVIVTIGTVRGNADGDAHLSRCFGSGDREANSSQSN